MPEEEKKEQETQDTNQAENSEEKTTEAPINDEKSSEPEQSKEEPKEETPSEISKEAPKESPAPETSPKNKSPDTKTGQTSETPKEPSTKPGGEEKGDFKDKISHEVEGIVKDVKNISMEDVKHLDIHSEKGHHFLIIIICASLFVVVLFLGVYSFLLKPSYGPNSIVVCKIDKSMPLPQACEETRKCKELDRSEVQEMNDYLREGYVNCTPFKVKRQ